MEKHPINLFQTQVTYSPTLSLMERYLRVARYVLLSFLFGVGVVTLVVFIIIRFQEQSLDRQRQALYSSVQNNMTKEAMLLALRARVTSLMKIMQFQVSIAPYIDTTLLIASPPRLTSFSLGDGSLIRIGVDAQHLEEAIDIIKTVVQLTNENKIKNPTITSIVLDKDGTVTLGFTYVIVL
ncbi:MAG: hypothetical protein V1917_03005 [Candidatus Gottesmanbacteria bacterium]